MGLIKHLNSLNWVNQNDWGEVAIILIRRGVASVVDNS